MKMRDPTPFGTHGTDNVLTVADLATTGRTWAYPSHGHTKPHGG